jgi:hypothetical protein
LPGNGPIHFNLPMSSNGTMPPDPDLPLARSMVPPVDDFGLPVKVKHTSMWLVYLVMTGGWICVLASGAMTVYNEFFYYLPVRMAFIVASVGFGAAVVVGSTLAKLKHEVSRRFAVAAVVVGVASAVLMLLSLDPPCKWWRVGVLNAEGALWPGTMGVAEASRSLAERTPRKCDCRMRQ